MNYQDLSSHSRVWIYQSNREFTDQEVAQIRDAGKRFIASWAAHGTSLHAALEVFHNRFIILFADEAQVKASGCSIDSSVHFMKEVEKAFGVILFDRMQIAYSKEQISKGAKSSLEPAEGEQKVEAIHMNDLRSQLESGEFSDEVYIFNNLVATKAELESSWNIPLKESWLFQMSK